MDTSSQFKHVSLYLAVISAGYAVYMPQPASLIVTTILLALYGFQMHLDRTKELEAGKHAEKLIEELREEIRASHEQLSNKVNGLAMKAGSRNLYGQQEFKENIERQKRSFQF